MSDFSVKVTKIESIFQHPNADLLEMCKVEGTDYQFCIKKGEYRIEDKVIYFPIDSLLPDNIIDKLGVRQYLSKGCRVRTTKLRGEISQGLVCKASEFNDSWEIGKDVTDELGVIKYEPPMTFCRSANMTPLPPELNKYDIENIENYKKIKEYLIETNKEVVITEKLEGTNFAYVYYDDGREVTCSRNHSIIEKEDAEEENTYCKIAKKYKLNLFGKCALESNPTWKMIAFYGEIIGTGIQGNIYRLKDQQLKIFDIKIVELSEDGIIKNIFLDYYDLLSLLSRSNFYLFNNINIVNMTVPELFVGPINDFIKDSNIKDLSNGKSVLYDTLREGIVIKPLKEEYFDRFGRLIIKQRSPEYLAKEK